MSPYVDVESMQWKAEVFWIITRKLCHSIVKRPKNNINSSSRRRVCMKILTPFFQQLHSWWQISNQILNTVIYDTIHTIVSFSSSLFGYFSFATFRLIIRYFFCHYSIERFYCYSLFNLCDRFSWLGTYRISVDVMICFFLCVINISHLWNNYK